MARFNHHLNSVKIASPCSVDWEDMIGNDRRRFCGQCELNVFNLSDMTTREAEELINQTQGRLCVRFFKRDDGTILTTDCPVGLQAMRRRLSRLRVAVVSTVLGFLAGLGIYSVGPEIDNGEQTEYEHLMGAMVAPDKLVRPSYQLSDTHRFDVTGELAIQPIKLSKVHRGNKRKQRVR